MFFKSHGWLYRYFKGVLPKSDAYEQNFSEDRNIQPDFLQSSKMLMSFIFQIRQKNKKFFFKKFKACESKYSLKNFYQDFLLLDLLSSELSSSILFRPHFFLQDFFFIFFLQDIVSSTFFFRIS